MYDNLGLPDGSGGARLRAGSQCVHQAILYTYFILGLYFSAGSQCVHQAGIWYKYKVYCTIRYIVQARNAYTKRAISDKFNADVPLEQVYGISIRYIVL